MKKNIDRTERRFARLIQDVDKIILPFIESIDIEHISKHNAGYKNYKNDRFKHFIENEKKRFVKALDIIVNDKQDGSVCDLGCFIPYLPVALSLLNYNVKIVDKYDFYGREFKDTIIKLAERYKIDVFDIDILNDNIEVLNKNDIVLLMAVVEHLNGTPRFLFDKIHHLLSENGFFLFETPNIADFAKRIRMLLGYSPLPDYKDFFHSAYPFTGHNREMTVSEVIYLFEHTGFKIEQLKCYDYVGTSELTARGKVLKLIKSILPLKNKGQSILVKGKVSR